MQSTKARERSLTSTPDQTWFRMPFEPTRGISFRDAWLMLGKCCWGDLPLDDTVLEADEAYQILGKKAYRIVTPTTHAIFAWGYRVK